MSSGMLGDFLLGEGMLGGDPDTSSGSGGGTGVGNMLGGFFVGETMLGGDPGSGSDSGGSGSVGSSGNSWQLVAVIHNDTTVHGDLTKITQFIQARTSAGSTAVAGRLSLVPEQLTAAVIGRTSVRGGLYSPIALTGAITDHTTVHAQATQSILRGRVQTSTSVTGSITYTIAQLRPQTVRGATAITATLRLAPDQLVGQSISCRTVVTANATKPFQAQPGTIGCGTSVTGSLSRHILAGKIRTSTTVVGAASLRGQYGGTIRGKTTVTGQAVLNPEALTGVAHGSATVTGRLHDYPTDFQDITIHTSTRITNAALNLFEVIKSGQAAITGRTTVTGKVVGQWSLHAAVNPKTTVHGNVTFPRWFSSGQIITGSTTVTADAFKSTLHGGYVKAGTVVTGTQNVASRPSGAIHGGTKVTVAFYRSYNIFGNVNNARTVVKARLHVYPIDFQDVRLYDHTTVGGSLSMLSIFKASTVSTIAGRTVITATPSISVLLRTNTITGSTKVTGNVRYAFGYDLSLGTIVHGRLGIRTGINTWKPQTIKGKTTIVAQPPDNYFKGLAKNGTVVKGAITVGYATTGTTIVAATTFRSHFPGRNAHDGPVGTVNLTAVPRGDLGIPSEISGSTTPAADITIERQRVLTVFGNAGLSVEKTLVAHGTATAGNETRYVGEPFDAHKPVSAYNALYV